VAVVVLLLLAAALPRLYLAWRDHGFFWPDEIYQTLEQGHRLAFGYGLVPWEFQDGARSWLYPGLLGGIFKLAAALGVRRALTLVSLAKSAMALLSVVGVAAGIRLAARRGGRMAALLACVLLGAEPISLVFGSRCMTETASGPLVLLAVLAMDRPGRRPAALAGALAALTIFLRYQNGLLAAGLLVVLLGSGRRGDALGYLGGAVPVGLAGGLLDFLTWGRPFHSFVRYLQFNFLEGRAALFGTEQFGYYGRVAAAALGPALVVLLAGWLLALRRARGLALLVAVYLLVHSLVPHKELRFLVPVVPLALTVVAIGLGDGLARLRGGGVIAVGLAAALVLTLGWQTRRLTFGRLGQPLGGLFGPAFADQPPWHAFEGANRLLALAGERADLCGLAVVDTNPFWVGGYTYLHRDVPLFWQAQTPAERAAVNYLVAPLTSAPPAGPALVSIDHGFALYRREGGCALPPAGYARALPALF
jgi:hypothetical protein